MSSAYRFKEAVCHYYKQTGHIARVCCSKAKCQRAARPNNRDGAKNTHQVTEPCDSPTSDTSCNLFNVEGTRNKAEPIMVTMNVNGADVPMEVDTGAHFSLISESTYNNLWSGAESRLLPATIPLQAYTGERLSILGTIDVTVKHTFQSQQEQLKLLVVAGSGPSLVGRDWMKRIRLDWKSIGLFHVQATPQRLNDVLNLHTAMFMDELGLIKGTTAKI